MFAPNILKSVRIASLLFFSNLSFAAGSEPIDPCIGIAQREAIFSESDILVAIAFDYATEDESAGSTETTAIEPIALLQAKVWVQPTGKEFARVTRMQSTGESSWKIVPDFLTNELDGKCEFNARTDRPTSSLRWLASREGLRTPSDYEKASFEKGFFASFGEKLKPDAAKKVQIKAVSHFIDAETTEYWVVDLRKKVPTFFLATEAKGSWSRSIEWQPKLD